MFDGSVDFSTEIEKRVKTNGGCYLDAVVDVCDHFGIDHAAIAKHLTKRVIERIKMEAGQPPYNLLRSKEKGKISRLQL